MESSVAEGAAGEDTSPAQAETDGSTTCSKLPVCTRGPECSNPKDEASFDRCAASAKQKHAATPTTGLVIAKAAPRGGPGSLDLRQNQEAHTDEELGKAGPAASRVADAARGEASLTPEEQQAVRKERRERARQAKRAQVKGGDKSGRKGSKRRWGRNKSGKDYSADRGRGAGEDSSQGPFDEWLGLRLKAWRDGEGLAEGGGVPPEGSGVPDEIDFDPSKDEIAFPPSLSALQRRQVHGWAMQLALFHASSGEDKLRHVIISKTGVFPGKLLTRGGRTWYTEGVTAPVVKRFALQPGHEPISKPLIEALNSFNASIQLREAGFAKWLKESAPGPLDGSDRGIAQAAFEKWPLLEDGEWEYIDTPGQLASLVTVLESCKEFGFDLEAHNARTYHGLTCLLQITTESKDYVVDPLAEGMWDCMSQLRGPFGNGAILKIGHAIRSCDVPSLYRDFGIVIVNAIDTEEAVHALGEKHSGLAKVLENAGIKEQHDVAGLKQKMQACDWRERPLTADKTIYARCDSHYLIPLWHLLRARLLGADTYANREDAREEEEIRDIERRMDAQQEANVEKHRQQFPGAPAVHAASEPPPSAGVHRGNPAGNTGEGARIGRAVSPVAMAEEPWTSEWDNPEDCHRLERSRSASSFRSDLESINETAADVSAISAAFLEEEDDGEGEDCSVGEGGGNGNGVDLLPLDLGENLVGDDEPADDGGACDDDEDEDLWEGWGGAEAEVETASSNETKGERPLEGAALPPEPVSSSAASSETRPVSSNGAARNQGSDALPRSNGAADVASSSSPQSDTGQSSLEVSRAGARKGSKGTDAALLNEQHVLHTDGVRLLWKALSRTQQAVIVLWRPAAEAKRQDSHNERHFRTAVQRLKPPRWTELNVRVYEDIYLWRDRTARRMDDGTAYVCPGDILIDVALALPRTLEDLRRVSAPLSPVLGDADTAEAVELVRVVRVALGLPADEQQEGAGGIDKSPGVASDTANTSNKGLAKGSLPGRDDSREKRDRKRTGAAIVLALASMAALGVLVVLTKPRR